MTDDIQSQIDRIADRRFLGCVAKFSGMVILLAIAYGLVVKHSHDRATHALAAFGLAGLVFGFVAAGLAPVPRKILNVVFIVVPIAASVIMFVMRTVLGHADQLSLRLVLTPIVFTLGFLLGQLRRPRLF